VVARVLSENPTKRAAWQVDFLTRAETRGFLIKINGKGELFLEPSPWKSAEAFRQIDPSMGPIKHSAIKPGNEFNKLLLILRKREVVIFVNGVQVCDPVKFEYDITPSGLCFGVAGPGPKRAEFDRLEIREMMQPDGKPPKAEPAPSVAPAVVKPADRPMAAPTRLDNPTQPITNSIGMKMKLIPAGAFMMGSPETDTMASDDEKPEHPVRISRPFYLGVTEVTQAQFNAVRGYNPSYFSASGRGRDQVADQSTDGFPVEQVTWLEAVEFCNKLSEKEGQKPFYEIHGNTVNVPDWNRPGYRLPTEAEWEYACRANSETRYSFGDDPAELGEHAWYGGNSGRRTHPVAQKLPNDFGLFDMHGNVWEWCWDGCGNYEAHAPVVDPLGLSGAAHRVERGGAWPAPPRNVRSARRMGLVQGFRNNALGFRLARAQSVR
jgi:formylglycine-generating enzyme required for sulfatase activity